MEDLKYLYWLFKSLKLSCVKLNSRNSLFVLFENNNNSIPRVSNIACILSVGVQTRQALSDMLLTKSKLEYLGLILWDWTPKDYRHVVDKVKVGLHNPPSSLPTLR